MNVSILSYSTLYMQAIMVEGNKWNTQMTTVYYYLDLYMNTKLNIFNIM